MGMSLADAYKMGDRGRLRGDLAIEFLGRRDDQVKVRGVRIEPREIELALQAHPAVAAAVVLARHEEPFGTRLIACYEISRDIGRDISHETRGDAGVLPAVLTRWLGERLPDAMIPAAFVPVPEMPRLESGKIDRARARVRRGARGGREKPRPRRRRTNHRPAANTCRAPAGRCLVRGARVSPVGVTETFFELGGDSLLIVRVVAKARAAGLPVTAEGIYRDQDDRAHLRASACCRFRCRCRY